MMIIRLLVKMITIHTHTPKKAKKKYDIANTNNYSNVLTQYIHYISTYIQSWVTMMYTQYIINTSELIQIILVKIITIHTHTPKKTKRTRHTKYKQL